MHLQTDVASLHLRTGYPVLLIMKDNSWLHTFCTFLQVACQLLQHSEGRQDQAGQAMRALAAAAQAALAVNAATTATIAQALIAAEQNAAGRQ